MGTADRRRAAFTLIELLFVMAIIAILVAMAVVAFQQVGNTATVTTVSTEFSQLTAAHAAARKELNDVPYLPSKIRLYVNYSDYDMDNTAFAKSSRAFLFQAFGKYLWGGASTGYSKQVFWAPTMTPASGSAGPDGTLPGGVTLYADQSLVFWLAGINLQGFSTDVANPSNFAPGIGVKGPFYEFPTDRLVQQPNGFFQFADPFSHEPLPPAATGQGQVPYYYFSSYRLGNDYNRGDAWPIPSAGVSISTVSAGPVGSNTSIITTSSSHGLSGWGPNQQILITGVTGTTNLNGTWVATAIPSDTTIAINLASPNYTSGGSLVPVPAPYTNGSTGRYINERGFQLICAGKDGLFGLGGAWNPATGYGPGQVGSDDKSNFASGLLGTGQNQ